MVVLLKCEVCRNDIPSSARRDAKTCGREECARPIRKTFRQRSADAPRQTRRPSAAAAARTERRVRDIAVHPLADRRRRVPELELVVKALDTPGPARDLVVRVFEWAADVERTRRQRPERASTAPATKGRGRPRRDFDVQSAQQLLLGGLSYREIATRFGVPVATVHRHLQPVPKQSPARSRA